MIAKNMDIVNKSKFKSVTIMNVKTWSERISGNNIVLGSEKAVFSIYKNVTVSSLTAPDYRNIKFGKKASVKTVNYTKVTPEPTATATPEVTPEPTATGETIGEWDVDLDETPTPTATPEPTATAGEEPTAADGTGTQKPADETPSDGTSGPEATPDGGKPADRDNTGSGMPVWGWVAIGAAALACAGGAGCAVVASKRKAK